MLRTHIRAVPAELIDGGTLKPRYVIPLPEIIRVAVLATVLSAVLLPGGVLRPWSAEAQDYEMYDLCNEGSVEQFADVRPDSYGGKYIHCMRALGFSLGRGDGTYGPDRDLTRAQMASFLVRLWLDAPGNECPEGPAAPFTDIADSVHQANIECLFALGITKGVTPTTYGPSQKLTASQLSRFLVRLYERSGNACPGVINDLEGVVTCLVSLNVAPTTRQAKSATPVTRAHMAVYLIGLWHNMSGRGLPQSPPYFTAEEVRLQAAEFHLIDLVNGLRSGLGLQTYEYDRSAAGEAWLWVRAMARTGTAHRNPSLTDLYADRDVEALRVGQNVWQLPDVGDASLLDLTENAFEAMQADPGAYRAMTDSRFNHTGVGILVDGNGFWVVQDFVQFKEFQEAEIRDGERYVSDLVNELRASLGVGPMQYHPDVAVVARNWSRTMADANRFKHNPSFSSEIPPGWVSAGENIVRPSGRYQTVREAMKVAFDAWVGSPGHYRNMIRSQYTHTGVGLYIDSDGRFWVTQNFAEYR